MTAKKIAYLGGNHLNDLLAKSKVVVLVYDENQIMNKSQIWTDDAFLKLEHEANLKGNLIMLHNQMRIHATKETVEWIRNLIDAGVVNEVPIDNDYDIRVFDSPEELQSAIMEKNDNQSLGISRLTATYDWEYSSQSKPKDSDYWCVRIGDWSCPWNRQLAKEKESKHLSWIEQSQTIHEIGSTFTVQGFDLNYVGVIIGPSVKYRDGKIIFDISESKIKVLYRTENLNQVK